MRRPIPCRHCGKTFTPATDFQTLCPDCRLAAKRASYRRDRTCADCGKTFVGVPRQKRCPDCQAKAEAAANIAHKRNGPRRPIGSTDACQRCGKPYTVAGGAQRYCPDCGPIARADNERAKKRAHAAAQRAAGIPTRHPPRLHICVCCGKTFVANDAATTCSSACHAAAQKTWQRKADQKRRGKH